MNKKLFLVSETIDIEDMVLANSEKEAEEIMKSLVKKDSSYLLELIGSYYLNFYAKEINRKQNLPNFYMNEFAICNNDGDYSEQTCGEMADLIEEEWQKKENFKTMDEKQLKFSFY